MKPSVACSRRTTVRLRKYATDPQSKARVECALAALPPESLYAVYLRAQLEREPQPYTPRVVQLENEVAKLRVLLAGER